MKSIDNLPSHHLTTRTSPSRIDRYDRDVRTVYVNGKDVGLAQLDAGLAWWFRKYAHEQLPRDRIDYEAAEDRVGLWQDKHPVPPWEWRHEHVRSEDGLRP